MSAKIHEFEKHGIKISAPEDIVVDAIMAHLGPAPTVITVFDRVIGGTEQPPRLGQHWRGQGGVYAGIMRAEAGKPDYHLIVPTDPAANLASLVWGGYEEDCKGATSDCDGLANTAALLADCEDHPVLKVCRDVVIEGHRDFYLPARRELSLCFANVRELFETDDWFWSSTQLSAYHAWYQYFDNGSQDWNSKDYEGRARAVRRVLIQ